MNKKLEIAVEFLKEGKLFTVDDIRLELKSENTIAVVGWSEFLNFKNITRKTSIDELARIKEQFDNMLKTSENLQGFLTDKSIEYTLCYDDGGKASINICNERDGIIEWLVNIN